MQTVLFVLLLRHASGRSLRSGEKTISQEGRVAVEPTPADTAKKHRGVIVSDPQPTILNFSDPSVLQHRPIAALHGGPFSDNPKNGTPWFRMKSTSEQGQSSHAHFDGLASTGDFVSDVTAAHNAVRARVGVPNLRWNVQLEKLANDYVHTLVDGGCYISHSSTGYRWSEAGFQYVGENLYKVINMAPTGVDVVDAWYAEIDDYTYGPVGSSCVKERCAGRTSPPCSMGHFTQVMWQSSTDFGCARQKCAGQSQETYIVVCHYGEGGNIVGEIPFSQSHAAQLGVGERSCA